MGRSAILIIAGLVVVLLIFSRHSPSSDGQAAPVAGGSGSTTAHLKVVPTIRSVTVSPGSVTYGNCSGGSGYTNSAGNTLGYPNGSCTVGTIGVNESFPITVTYTGIPGSVYVSGSGAAPADNGTGWTLCSPPGSPQGQSACTGVQGLPGNDQYMVMNFAEAVENAEVLTATPACDKEFDSHGGCAATPQEFKNQAQHEGLLLTGPKSWNDHSTSWTMTVTWTAVGSS
ncbi:MAG TPA: hypothetical protein VGG16_15940 [Streptosporangiaceae bacterium]